MTQPKEVRDRNGRLVRMVVDGIAYRDWERGDHTPGGLFQIVSDGSRATFPAGAMTTTPADLDTGRAL